MKRIFDLIFGVIALCIFALPITVIFVLILFTTYGHPIYWSERVGKDNKIFKMPKFRTMRIDTPVVAAHLLVNPKSYLTPIGSFLRMSSLDELPQIWSILIGDMSFVGPRPALFNQYQLIEMRTKKGVHTLVPGLTGWAQINGRDELDISGKVLLDYEYLQHKNMLLDIKILLVTVLKVMRQDGISN